ncbi:MAG: glycosyltransferase family 4 protein [Candidatus Nealsonbacteria bacterium]|nr:glycosyltransferase family 4 protein [Candidatus Nealsonbacteria bacterium]
MNERRLTVVQVLPELESGGVERGTLEVAGELVRRGHRSIVVSGGGRLVEQLTAQGSHHVLWPVHRKSLLTLRYVRPMRRLLRDRRADVLHVRSRVPAWVAYLAWRRMKPAQRPRLVTTCHGLYSVNRYSRVMTRGERVIAISQTVRRYITENYPATDPQRIRLIYRGIDPAAFPHGYRPTPEWLDRWYSEYPQLRDRPVVTLPGRLTRYKGHHAFLTMMARLKQRAPQVRGVIVGGEDKRRRAYAEEIRRRVFDEGLDNVLLTGHRSDVREVYAASDAIVSVSSNPPEAFGRTVLEALSLGVPVVGFDGSGPGEVLGRILPQGLVAAGDVDALADRVCEFLANPPTVGRNTTFTLQAMLDQTLDLYQELASERPGPAPARPHFATQTNRPHNEQALS